MNEIDEVNSLIKQIANITNQLIKKGVVKQKENIVSDYAKWFCSKKYTFKLNDTNEKSFDALSKLGERVLIRTRIGSEFEFNIEFTDICVECCDYLLLVFLNEDTWMIESIYQISQDILRKFKSLEKRNGFEWNRESRSLSMQIYPNDNSILLI
jgi:hypothetical protein